MTDTTTTARIDAAKKNNDSSWRFHNYSIRDIHSRLGYPCQITFQTPGKKPLSGVLYNIDPETRTVLVLQTIHVSSGLGGIIGNESDQQETLPQQQTTASAASSSYAMVAIRDHAIATFTIITNSLYSNRMSIEQMDQVLSTSTVFSTKHQQHLLQNSLSRSSIQSRKEFVLKALQAKRIDAIEKKTQTLEDIDGGLISVMNDLAQIKPPFLASSVESSVPNVKSKIRGMVQDILREMSENEDTDKVE